MRRRARVRRSARLHRLGHRSRTTRARRPAAGASTSHVDQGEAQDEAERAATWSPPTAHRLADHDELAGIDLEGLEGLGHHVHDPLRGIQTRKSPSARASSTS